MTTGPHDLQTFMLTCEATLTFQYSGTEKYSIFLLLISGVLSHCLKGLAFLHQTFYSNLKKKMMYMYLDIVLYCITADKEPFTVKYSQDFDPTSLPAGSVLISVRIPKLLKVLLYIGDMTSLCT